MALEAQAMDLYARAAENAPDEASRRELERMAQEERGHLKHLGVLMDALMARKYGGNEYMSTSRRRRLRGIALMAVFAVVIAACGNGTEATTTTAAETRNPVPVRIGAILPQTGGLSSIIAALEQPLRMAADEFNAASAGLVTVDFTDSGTDPNIASQNIDQYLSGNHNACKGSSSPEAAAETQHPFHPCRRSALRYHPRTRKRAHPNAEPRPHGRGRHALHGFLCPERWLETV